MTMDPRLAKAIADSDLVTQTDVEDAQRIAAAERLLEENDIKYKQVMFSWMECESDWPGDTILYLNEHGQPMTVVVRNDSVTEIKGWDSP